MIGGTYIAGGAALAICLAAIGGYFKGEGDGANSVKAEDDVLLAAAYSARDKAEERMQQVSLAAANANTTRQNTFREIDREVPKIIDRPVYGNVCVDADGVRLLDKAATAANGGDDTGQPSGGPGATPAPAAQH